MIIDTYTVKVKFDIDRGSLRNINAILNRYNRMFNIPVRLRINPADLRRLNELRAAANRIDVTTRGSSGGTALGVGVAVIDQVKKAKEAAASYEEKFIDVKVALKQTGQGTQEQIQKIDELARKIGATTRFTASEAMDGVDMLLRNGVEVQHVLDGMLTSSVSLAIANRAPLKESADILTDLMAAYRRFGVTAEEASNTFYGATLASKFGWKEMGDAMRKAGPTAANYGPSIQQLGAVLAMSSSNYASGAPAGTGLIWALKGIDGKSGKAKALLDKIGFEFTENGKYKDMSLIIQELTKHLGKMTEVEKNIAINKGLYGFGLNTYLAWVTQGSAKFDEILAKQKLASVEDAARIKSTEGLTAATTQLKSAIEGLYLAIINQDVLDFLSELTRSMTEGVAEMTTGVERLHKALKAFNRGQSALSVYADLNNDIADQEGFAIGQDPDSWQWTRDLQNWGRAQAGLKPLEVIRQSPLPAALRSNFNKQMLEINARGRSFIPNETQELRESSVGSNNQRLVDKIVIQQTFRNSDPSTVREAARSGVSDALLSNLNRF